MVMNPETLLRRIEAAQARYDAAMAAERNCLAKAKTWRERAAAALDERDWLTTNPALKATTPAEVTE
jgi:hypothetical protein